MTTPEALQQPEQWTHDALALELQALRLAAGAPSYAEIVSRVIRAVAPQA